MHDQSAYSVGESPCASVVIGMHPTQGCVAVSISNSFLSELNSLGVSFAVESPQAKVAAETLFPCRWKIVLTEIRPYEKK